MLAKGCIELSVSLYSSPVLFVRKRTGELWMCIHFHALNCNETKDFFPLPHIYGFLDKLGNNKYFSFIELAIAYH